MVADGQKCAPFWVRGFTAGIAFFRGKGAVIADSQKRAPFWVLGFTAGSALDRGKEAVIAESQKCAPFWVRGFTAGIAFSRGKAAVIADSQKRAPFWVLGLTAGCYGLYSVVGGWTPLRSYSILFSTGGTRHCGPIRFIIARIAKSCLFIWGGVVRPESAFHLDLFTPIPFLMGSIREMDSGCWPASSETGQDARVQETTCRRDRRKGNSEPLKTPPYTQAPVNDVLSEWRNQVRSEMAEDRLKTG